jgi:hypothetical protein
VRENPWPYRVDGELGRFEFPTYRVCDQETTLYDPAREVFVPIGCWERYETKGFKEIAFIRGVTEQSCRKTTTLFNRLRHQPDATASTTLRKSAEREGTQIMACLERTTTTILSQKGLPRAGQPLAQNPLWAQGPTECSPDVVKVAIDACELPSEERAEVERNPVLYEQPTKTVNISIDDVVVKQQKRHRTNGDDVEEGLEGETASSGRKYVHQTVAHIQHQQQTYGITGQGVPAVLRIVLAYLLNNALLGCRLQFFVDGQKTLQAAILRAFAWFNNLGLILDWYHLEDKCARQLSWR